MAVVGYSMPTIISTIFINNNVIGAARDYDDPQCRHHPGRAGLALHGSRRREESSVTNGFWNCPENWGQGRKSHGCALGQFGKGKP